ncbi:solute carrier family 22 member 13 [Plutella xylostella]|uniref:solute carrier family 22 member 13 n=1 Tax=Plutella xylostella TaxID=51655 RepID=UPI002032DB32|nr:solute carrier family 22 member 13 [Plutella xylostella]
MSAVLSEMSKAVELKIDVAKNGTDPPKQAENDKNNNAATAQKLDFDDLLIQAGQFGLYQIILILATMPFYIYGVFVYYTQLFITEVSTQHWCWVPELENLTAVDRRRLAIPLDESGRYGYDQCKAYVANWTEVLLSGKGPDSTWDTEPCQYGWEFEPSEIPYPTISSELGWVCDKRSYQASAQSIFFFGSIFGGFLIGWLADRYGRLPAIIASNLIGCIGGTASIFVSSFIEFAICRFIMGMAYDNSVMIAYLLLLEYIAPKYRTLISNLSFALFYTLGSVALPWIALACGHWKVTSLATSLPMALAIFAPFILFESPRWLLTRGRIDDAIQKLKMIGKVNRKEIPSKLIKQFKEEFTDNNGEEQGTVLEILKRPLVRKMLILICIEYMCCVIVFDALVRSLGQLQFDFFLSFSVVSFTEFPSLLILAIIMDWTGRRWLVSLMSTVSCIFCVLTALIGGGIPALVCAVVARFAINMSYTAAIQWGAELFPTSVRGSALGVIHILGYIGTMISPYIVYLEIYISWLPLVAAGVVAACSAVVALTLPETAKKDMPQTFAEAETLARSQRFFEIPCFPRKTEADNCGQEKFPFEP